MTDKNSNPVDAGEQPPEDKPTSPAADAEIPGKSQAQKSSPRKRAKVRKPIKKRTQRDKHSEALVARAAKYPRHHVERALRIPKAIYEQNGGRPATPLEAVKFAGGAALTGPWRTEISSAKKFGFLEATADSKLALTNRARQAIAPQSPNDRVNALREGVLAAPDLSEVYNFYRGENLPDQPFFVNALTDRFSVPADKVGEFLEIFNQSVQAAELVDETGNRPRLIDVGRDEHHKAVRGTRPSTKEAAAGATCFVVQPFSGPLGGYYETIYKPAIEQAGLHPLRADAEIFGTGKIMDQIWRGIRAAKVLVAELTTKNPNVFYELGLAHALEKPVVLVSSNQEDVPFDLRHIRVILYDQTDPFWGQKLIDKLADNVRTALTEPEQAIFRIADA